MKKNLLDIIALILVLVGAINWGLALVDINLVTLILGSIPVLVKIVYAVVGVAGLYGITWLLKLLK